MMERTTALSEPWRVMNWGPLLLASSITSVRRFFASCTCQIAMKSPHLINYNYSRSGWNRYKPMCLQWFVDDDQHTKACWCDSKPSTARMHEDALDRFRPYAENRRSTRSRN